MVTVIPSKKYESVRCADCGDIWPKRKDSIKDWHGRCRSCAQKIEKSDPILKNRMSILARAQVIKQGGVPNARHFGSPGRETFGKNNWRWRGGKCDKHTGFEYFEWRRKVYLRDGFSCQMCGKIGEKIHAHHIKSFSK